MDTEAFLGVPYIAGKRGIFAFFRNNPNSRQGTVVIFQQKSHIFQLLDKGVYRPTQDALISLMLEINHGQYDESLETLPMFIGGAAGTYISTALYRLQRAVREKTKREEEVRLPYFTLHLPKKPSYNGFVAFFYNNTTHFYIVHTRNQCIRVRDEHIAHFKESQKDTILRRFSEELSQTSLPEFRGEMLKQLPPPIAYIFLEAISCTP
ncbi:MAG: hypothetical protein CL685_02795 [Candidatus Magasanikbacteria bacterium]|nr:hypothetical protein [Candidatus Magasanikbacteria bacterium]|tara:strand:- start:341 stop:964 length:624 start_codon:yes stop_codon:yes gene_type:complete